MTKKLVQPLKLKPKVVEQPTQKQRYWTVYLGPLNWLNPDSTLLFPSEESSMLFAERHTMGGHRVARVHDPDGNLVKEWYQGQKPTLKLKTRKVKPASTGAPKLLKLPSKK